MFPFQSSPFQILDVQEDGYPVIITLAANTAEERQKWANALKRGHFALTDSQMQVEERLAEFYRKFAPEKLKDMRFIPKLVHLFKGREQDLCDKLCKKYCPRMLGILSPKNWAQVKNPEAAKEFALEGVLLRQKHYPQVRWHKSYFVLQDESLYRYAVDITPSILRTGGEALCPTPETVYTLFRGSEHKVAMADGLGFCVEVEYHGTHAVLMLSAESISEKERWVSALNTAIAGEAEKEEKAEEETPVALLLDFPELADAIPTSPPAKSPASEPAPLTVATDVSEEESAVVEKKFRQMGHMKKKGISGVTVIYMGEGRWEERLVCMVDDELHVYPLTLGIENGYDCEEGIRAVKPESVIDLPSTRTVVDAGARHFRKNCLEVLNAQTLERVVIIQADCAEQYEEWKFGLETMFEGNRQKYSIGSDEVEEVEEANGEVEKPGDWYGTLSPFDDHDYGMVSGEEENVWKEQKSREEKQKEKAKRRNSVVFQNFLMVSVFDDEDALGDSEDTLKWENHKGIFGVLVGKTLQCFSLDPDQVDSAEACSHNDEDGQMRKLQPLAEFEFRSGTKVTDGETNSFWVKAKHGRAYKNLGLAADDAEGKRLWIEALQQAIAESDLPP
jgi:hypothetical protein